MSRLCINALGTCVTVSGPSIPYGQPTEAAWESQSERAELAPMKLKCEPLTFCEIKATEPKVDLPRESRFLLKSEK